MKINWGKATASVIILFILGMGFMVYKSVTKNIDLVTPDYYEKEVKYQEQIDKINNSNSLKEQIKIENTESGIIIDYPEISGVITGEVAFYRPSDARQDFRVPVLIGQDSKQQISTGSLQKGLWKVQVNWKSEGREFFYEEKLMIQ